MCSEALDVERDNRAGPWSSDVHGGALGDDPEAGASVMEFPFSVPVSVTLSEQPVPDWIPLNVRVMEFPVIPPETPPLIAVPPIVLVLGEVEKFPETFEL